MQKGYRAERVCAFFATQNQQTNKTLTHEAILHRNSMFSVSTSISFNRSLYAFTVDFLVDTIILSPIFFRLGFRFFFKCDFWDGRRKLLLLLPGHSRPVHSDIETAHHTNRNEWHPWSEDLHPWLPAAAMISAYTDMSWIFMCSANQNIQPNRETAHMKKTSEQCKDWSAAWHCSSLNNSG